MNALFFPLLWTRFRFWKLTGHTQYFKSKIKYLIANDLSKKYLVVRYLVWSGLDLDLWTVQNWLKKIHKKLRKTKFSFFFVQNYYFNEVLDKKGISIVTIFFSLDLSSKFNLHHKYPKKLHFDVEAKRITWFKLICELGHLDHQLDTSVSKSQKRITLTKFE